jgi:hypothetical protein
MKKLILVMLLAVLLVSAQPRPCILTDFYGLSNINEPTLRHIELSRWLTTNGNNCSSEQLVVLWNNLSMWAGVADSSEVRAKVLYYYARAMEREKK